MKKKICFLAHVPAEFRAVPQPVALSILKALHRYIETGEGKVKPLSGKFEGLLRLRVGNHRMLFDETADTITIHRVRDRKDAYQQLEKKTRCAFLLAALTGRWNKNRGFDAPSARAAPPGGCG